VALDEAGKPSFNTLQNYGSSKAHLLHLRRHGACREGRKGRGASQAARSAREESVPNLAEPIRYSPALEASLADLVQSVKAQGFEGLVAKRQDSKYPGLRTGAWQKMRVNQGQELVIADYTPSSKSFDALGIGYYEDGNLMYAARTRNGFTPASRAELIP
jgi:bifunctional non-homologous end joining protein LigD